MNHEHLSVTSRAWHVHLSMESERTEHMNSQPKEALGKESAGLGFYMTLDKSSSPWAPRVLFY